MIFYVFYVYDNLYPFINVFINYFLSNNVIYKKVDMNKNRSRYSGWYKDLNFEKMTVTNDIYDFRIDNNVIY